MDFELFQPSQEEAEYHQDVFNFISKNAMARGIDVVKALGMSLGAVIRLAIVNSDKDAKASDIMESLTVGFEGLLEVIIVDEWDLIRNEFTSKEEEDEQE